MRDSLIAIAEELRKLRILKEIELQQQSTEKIEFEQKYMKKQPWEESPHL